MEGVIISVINHKGGCGKTTTACNLGHALASKTKKKVLLVDNDPQANSTDMLLGPVEPDFSLYELLASDQDTSIGQCIMETPYKNFFCLPNVPVTATLEGKLIEHVPESFALLRQCIREYAIKNFDITLIDNPPNLGAFVILALYASDFVIIPHDTGSRYSGQGLVKAAEFIKDIKRKGNPDLRFLRILLTQIHKKATSCKSIENQIRRDFTGDEIFDTTIPATTVFQQAENAGKTIIKYRPQAPGAEAYRQLAGEVVKILEKVRNPEKTVS